MRYFATLFALVLCLAACATTSELTRAQCEELSRSVRTAQAVAATPPPVAKCAQPLPPDTYCVSVVCDLTKAIAAGKYYWVSDYITPVNFPEAGCKAGQAEVTLVNFDREMRTDEVLAGLDKQGLRPATLAELLALRAGYPELPRTLWLVALGSVWRDPDLGVSAPILFGSDAERGLGLGWDYFYPENGWRNGRRVLALRK